MSMFQTPTQAHASIPAPSPAGLTFRSTEERARSQTRSQVCLADPRHASNVLPPTVPSSSNANNRRSIQWSECTNWLDSVSECATAAAVASTSLVLQQSTVQPSAAVNGQAQPPTPSPAQTLMKMGYVYVKANVLPNNGFGAGIREMDLREQELS